MALFIVIRDANNKAARKNIDEALKVTGEVFFNTLAQKRDRLLEKVRALSKDYAFKPAANTNEHKTVLSTLESYQLRAQANVMLLLSMEGEIIADTLHPELTAQNFYLPKLIEQAMNSEFGEADMLAFIDKKPYLLVAVPLFSPEPSHWVIMGFLITDTFSLTLQQTTKSHVSILFSDHNNKWHQLASTLSIEERPLSEQALDASSWQYDVNFDLDLNNKRYVSIALPIDNIGSNPFMALLQRPLDAALAPYKELLLIVAMVFLIALTLLIIGGIIIAKKITKPVTILAHGAKKIGQGHYDFSIKINQKDELGQLANRFNSMAKGLADRAKIKGLLGKVVSAEIAEQLLNNGVELGGEERQVTIIFSDIRNFTGLCESHSAKEVILLLNKLLTRLTKIIDTHHGVVDKYIGDAVMALYGVPVEDKNQALNAVLSAMDMQEELILINQEFTKLNSPNIGLGIGINTADVIAGNMGSITRLNYTVIGDGVNLSSRLEGLTKFYHIDVLVSNTTKDLCPSIQFREVDTVRVKGKQQGLTIYQPIGLKKLISHSESKQLDVYHLALTYYKKQDWQPCLRLLNSLINTSPLFIYQIYVDRVSKLQNTAYNPDWDGIFTHKQK